MNEDIYIVRAEEVKTVYGVTLFRVKAIDEEDARQQVLEDHNLEIIDSWDNVTDNVDFVNIDSWDIYKEKKEKTDESN
jgi:ArsR family metal-binding transcriptional regulator